MAKPFTFSTKRAGGNIYVQFALPDSDSRIDTQDLLDNLTDEE